MFGRAKLGRRTFVLLVTVVVFGAIAAGAIAATLRATASPKTAHKNALVTVTVSGSFKRSELKGKSGKGYLIAFVDVKGRRCKADAVKEYALGSGVGIYYAHSVGSPFSHAETRRGDVVTKFRICAYLYPRKITRSNHDAPLKRASVKFTITR